MLPELSEIKKRRKLLGLKQAELAKLAGVSQSLVAKIESGKIDPSYSKAKAIFETLEKLEAKEERRARDIMTRKLLAVNTSDKVEKAIRIMEKYNISQVPVFERDNAVGMISEQTIMEHVAKGMDLKQLAKISAGKVMDEAPPRVDEETPLKAITALLAHNSAVKKKKKGKVVGIITKADLLKFAH